MSSNLFFISVPVLNAHVFDPEHHIDTYHFKYDWITRISKHDSYEIVIDFGLNSNCAFLAEDNNIATNNCALKSILHNALTSIFFSNRSDYIKSLPNNCIVVEVKLKSEIDDPNSNIARNELLKSGIKNLQSIKFGNIYVIETTDANVPDAEIVFLIEHFLVNKSIHDYSFSRVNKPKNKPNITTASISIINLSDDALINLSSKRKLSLNLDEMILIRNYFSQKNREPTIAEIEMIAQTWSEHCLHKTFKSKVITQSGEIINNPLKTFIFEATQKINSSKIVSAFVDNAGVVEFDDEYNLAFKVETHNHPSAIDPFGGSSTGVGGVIRDILGVSASPIALTDVLCFGDIDCSIKDLECNFTQSILHPIRIQNGVVAGISDYGNKTGIPNVNGAILYNEKYNFNPLVFCGCVGIIPKSFTKQTTIKANTKIMLVGGETGRDGIGGATFSSDDLQNNAKNESKKHVQFGDPLTAKCLINAIEIMRNLKLYVAITDCGAGGLSSAIGEMSQYNGATVDLDKVDLKTQDMQGWEIWLSESQERMILAVEENNIQAVLEICKANNICASCIGFFNDDLNLKVKYKNAIIVDLDLQFLFDSELSVTRNAFVQCDSALIKQYFDLSCANHYKLDLVSEKNNIDFNIYQTQKNIENIFIRILKNPNILSKENLIRQYDSEIKGATIIKPFAGIEHDGPSDACVLKPIFSKSKKGIVISNGLKNFDGRACSYSMALAAIDEAIRNAICVGANPNTMALLDNFCAGNPTNEKTMGILVDAMKACHDASIYYSAPFISGKDSLYNEFALSKKKKHSIPCTLLISLIATIDDASKACSMDFKESDSYIYIIGDFYPDFEGSLALKCGLKIRSKRNTYGIQKDAKDMYSVMHNAISSGYVLACHDISDGGLAVSIAEMCFAGRIGAKIKLDHNNPIAQLFSESNSRFIVEISKNNRMNFENCFNNRLKDKITKIGKTSHSENLKILDNQNSVLIDISIDKLSKLFRGIDD